MARSSNNGRDGLLIDTWHWRHVGLVDQLADGLKGEGDDPVDGAGTAVKLEKDQVLDLEVRLLKEFQSTALPRPVNAVEFVVICKEIGLRLQGTDIEALRQAAWSKLEKEYEIKWEEFYLISIASARSFKGDYETGFALGQNTIYRGVTKDGSVLMRERDKSRNYSSWKYAPWPGEYVEKDGDVLACIPATKANDAALKEFRERIRELQDRLAELVRPEKIVQTLANLSGLGLPAPSSTSRTALDRADD